MARPIIGLLIAKLNSSTEDSTNAESTEQSTWVYNDWATKTYQIPNPEKLVVKVEVWSRYQYNIGRERNTRVYRYPSNTNVGYLTLNIPPYVLDDAGATHFEVNVDATREAGDDIWFELVDGENNQTYANADFGTKLALPGNIQRPQKLRIYINQSPSNSTIGGTFVHAVYWNSLQASTPSRTIDQTILFGVDWNSSRNGPIDNPAWLVEERSAFDPRQPLCRGPGELSASGLFPRPIGAIQPLGSASCNGHDFFILVIARSNATRQSISFQYLSLP